MNTKDITVDNIRLYILLYGKSGAGKTKMAGSFPKPYFFDCDDGVLTLKGMDVEYDIFKDLFRNDILVESGADKMEKKMQELDKECEWETLVLDSLTTYSQSMLLHLCKLNNHPKLTLHEYGLLVDHLRKLLKWLPVRFPTKHIVITAHEEMVKDEVFGSINIRPLVPGQKLSGELSVYFSEMYRLIVKGVDDKREHIVQTSAGTNYEAKSRLGLPSIIAPTFDAIMSGIKDA